MREVYMFMGQIGIQYWNELMEEKIKEFKTDNMAKRVFDIGDIVRWHVTLPGDEVFSPGLIHEGEVVLRLPGGIDRREYLELLRDQVGPVVGRYEDRHLRRWRGVRKEDSYLVLEREEGKVPVLYHPHTKHLVLVKRWVDMQPGGVTFEQEVGKAYVESKEMVWRKVRGSRWDFWDGFVVTLFVLWVVGIAIMMGRVLIDSFKGF